MTLGEIVDGGICLSEFGQVIGHHWTRIPDHATHMELDEWVVMPNHMYGIIVIALTATKILPPALSSAKAGEQAGSLPNAGTVVQLAQ